MKNNPQELERLQRHFWKLITAPNGVEKGLLELQKTEEKIAPLRTWIQGETEEFCAYRLNVYANMYFYRLHDTLVDDFKGIVQLLGEDLFYNIVTDYLLKYPSNRPTIQNIGMRFPQFLQEIRPTYPEITPWLHEFAAFEYQHIEVYLKENKKPIALESLQSVPQEQWGNLILEPNPAHSLLKTEYPVQKAWQFLKDKQLDFELEKESSALLLWKRDYLIQHALFPEWIAVLFEELCHGVTFAQLCEKTIEIQKIELQEAAPMLFGVLQQWFSDGLICGFTLQEE